MRILNKDWTAYINKLSKLSKIAAEMMQKYVEKNGFDNTDAVIAYAYGLVTKYGEGSAELSAQMYEAIADMQGAIIDAAIPAPTATYSETAKAIKGSLKQSPSGQLITSVTSRLVKQAGADTIMQNAVRDGAYYAWINSGSENCPYCLMISAMGWQRAGKGSLNDKHAEHIHANCDCQYIVDFKGNLEIPGYNPLELQTQIETDIGEDFDYEYASDFDRFLKANGRKSERGGRAGLNALRRQRYAENKNIINAQKRNAYAIRNENEDV